MSLTLPPGNFRAYLFDCDGTIADSMPLHYNAWKKALGEWNCVYPEELFYSWGGKPVRDIIADLNKMQGLNMPIESLAAARNRSTSNSSRISSQSRKCWKSSRPSTAGFHSRWFPGAAENRSLDPYRSSTCSTNSMFLSPRKTIRTPNRLRIHS